MVRVRRGVQVQAWAATRAPPSRADTPLGSDRAVVDAPCSPPLRESGAGGCCPAISLPRYSVASNGDSVSLWMRLPSYAAGGAAVERAEE